MRPSKRPLFFWHKTLQFRTYFWGTNLAIKEPNKLDLWRARQYLFTRRTSKTGRLFTMTQGSRFHDVIARHKALALALARDFPEADEETLADTIEGASNLP